MELTELRIADAPLNWIKELPVLPRQKDTKEDYKRKLAMQESVRKVHPTIHLRDKIYASVP
jgi:hypothetical protein